MPKRILQGVVLRDARDKTVIVRVERRVMHPVYKKFIMRSKNYAAHDEKNQSKAGDVVRIEESRPISRTKRWVALIGEGGATRQEISAAQAKVRPSAKRTPKSRAKKTASAHAGAGG